MITYIEQGTVDKTTSEQIVANTTFPARVSPKLEGSRPREKGLFA